MKKQLLLTCVAALTLMMSSCSKNEELKYSCDPDIDRWAVENYDALRAMDRSQFLKLESDAHQRAAYNVFSAEQRKEMWKGKLDQVLSLGIWNEQEVAHLKGTYDLLERNAAGFSDNASKTRAQIETEDDQLSLDAYLWREYATEELKWSYELQFRIIADFNDLHVNESKTIISTRADWLPDLDKDPKPKCNCTDLGWSCPLMGTSCMPGCTKLEKGCGFIGNNPCVGRC